MKRCKSQVKILFAISLALVALILIVVPSVAAPPWSLLLPFKKVDADPEKSYALHEDHGPWLVLAASFSGEGADRQAHELVLELRRRYKLTAYTHQQSYDYSQSFDGVTLTGRPTRMRYANADRFDGYAVLVGDFESMDDPNLEEALDKIKHVVPDCLNLEKREWSTQRFVGLRERFRRMNLDAAKQKKGPMGNAFVTRNPKLPTSYFVPQGGVDNFVVSLNRGVKYSLLDNPGKFTVRVATFRGQETVNQRQIRELEDSDDVSDKLAVAAERAHRLTVALRERGVEAYEYHDRNESVVTVGGFESKGRQLADGSFEYNSSVLKVMKIYGATRRFYNGATNAATGEQNGVGMQPRILAGIPFDVLPVPIEVPRRSIAADYARGSLFSH